MSKIRIAVAEDQELIRLSLELIINTRPDMEIVIIAEDGQKLLDSLKKVQADVVLMDVRMPVLNGVECTKIVKSKYPKIKIVILTTFEDDEYMFNAIKYGASGYLLKGVSTEKLLDSIRMAHEGGAVMSPRMAVKMFSYFSKMARGEMKTNTELGKKDEFSDNELRIIQLVGLGLSNKEISEEVNLSEGTCRNYISEILSKTGLKNKTQIAIFAIQSGYTYRLFGSDSPNDE